MSGINPALSNQNAQPILPSAHEIALEVVRRDQRRTRFLAAVCLLLWVLGAAGMLLLVVGLNEFVMGVRLNNTRLSYRPSAQRDTEQSGDANAPRDDGRIVWDDGTSLLHHTLPLIDGSLAALLLAALTTVWLIFSSRRTTLNRINISLAQISEQLKQLRRSPAVDAPHG
jgi:hypothetical protein